MKNRSLLLVILLAIGHFSFAQSWSPSENPASNFQTLRQHFYDYWDGKTPQPGQGYSVFKRWEWFWQSRVLPDGSFPTSNIKEVEWNNYLASLPQTESQSAANWTSMGPNSSAAGIGRINCIAVDPNNSNTIWVGAPTGGLWKTTNGGSSWTTTTDNLTVLSVTAVAIDPSNTNTMYLGTGDGFGNYEPSVGVLKSTDGGVTWNPTGLMWNLTNYRYIRHIIVHPTSTSTVLAATSDGIYRSTNGGTTWTKEASDNFFDVKFNPATPNIVYAASDNKLYKSTNTGDTWATSLTVPTSGRVVIAVTPANTAMVFAASSSDDTDTYGAFNGLYVSTDNGDTYTLKSSTPNLLTSSASGTSETGQGWYDFCIAVSPTNADLIFVGGVNLWKSTNGGASWSLATYWNNSGPPGVPVIHADKHALLWTGNTLYSGNDGGIHKTTNNGTSWTFNSGNLVISQMYRLGVSQSDNKVICGLQDNGTKLRSNTGVWTDNIGGDGMECFIHPTNSNIMYGESQYGHLRRSTNGGGSWTNIHANVPDEPDGAWVTPFVMDPNSPATIYAGYKEVFKSINQGNTWTAISDLNPVFDLQHIAVAPTSGNTIYACDGDQVFVTTDGGTVWNNVTGNLPTTNFITYLAVDPGNANTVYVTFGGYTAGQKVYRSITGGTTWTNISGVLPNIPANCITVQPNSGGVLYMGMDVGIYRRDAGASEWVLFNTGMPNVIVTELEIRNSTGKIRASTYGRGLWESDLEPLTACGTSATLSVTNIEPRAATLNWEAVNTALSYNVDVRVAGDPNWFTFSGIAGTSLYLVYFTPCTNYEFRVQAVCGGSSGAYSNIQSFSIPGCSNYCTTYGIDTLLEPPLYLPDEWIENVSVGSIDNTSGNDWGYNDYTNLSTDLTKGDTVAVTLTPGFSASAYWETWSVWVDWNQDNDFSDPGEQVFTHPGNTAAVTGSFTVPATALTGNTRMRVSMRWDSLPDPCGAFIYAEMEDYAVNVIAPVASLVINPSSLTFPAAGNGQTLTLTTNCDWSVTGVPAWLTVNPSSGTAGTVTLTVTATENTGIDLRAVTPTFSGCNGQAMQSLPVTQNGAAATLTLNPASLNFPATGNEQTLTLTTNCNWTVTGLPAWLTVSPSSGTAGTTMLTVTATENTDIDLRAVTLTFSACNGQVTQNLPVTQNGAAATLTINPASLNFPAMGDDQTLTLTANCDWSVTGLPAWLTVNPASGTAGTVTLTVTATENTGIDLRTVMLTFSACNGQAMQNLPVTQNAAAAALTLDPAGLTFPATGNGQTLTLTTNCDWTVTGLPAWLSVSPSSGAAGTITLTVTATENTGIDLRAVTLTFSGCNGQATQNLPVTQNGAAPALTLDPAGLTFPATGNGQTLTLTTNCDWSVTGLPAWLSISPTSGTAGTTTLTVTATENTGVDLRSVTLIFNGCNGQATQNLPVTQNGAAAALTLDPTSLTFPISAGSQTVTLTTNCDWSVTGLPAWLTVSPSSGTAGTVTLTVTAGQNLTFSNRSAILTFTGCNGQAVQNLSVTQNGVFVIDPSSLNFPAAGNSQTLTMSVTCFNWDLLYIPPWLTLNPSSGGEGTFIITVTASANNSADPRSFTLIFNCDDQIFQNVTVTQDGAQTFLDVPALVEVPATEGFAQIDVSSNTDWTAAENASWLEMPDPASGNGNAVVSVQHLANPDMSSRSEIVVFDYNGVQKTVTILQKGLSSGAGNLGEDHRNRVICVPNPASESAWFLIQTNQTQTVDIEVLASDGRIVTALKNVAIKQGENAIPWQPGDLPAGQYLFRCFFEKEVVSGKVVVGR